MTIPDTVTIPEGVTWQLTAKRMPPRALPPGAIPVTGRQVAVLVAVAGGARTFREVAEAIDVGSLETVGRDVDALRSKGLLPLAPRASQRTLPATLVVVPAEGVRP